MVPSNGSMTMTPPVVRLVFSTDLRGSPHVSTVIASVLRRTTASVEARIYTRGFTMTDFTTGRLSVSCRHCDEAVIGKYPAHVSQAVFDRLRIIRDEPDWDRVLVMDHDMLVLADLSEYFSEPFGENLLLGRLFGPGNTLELQMRQRGGLPESWQTAGPTPYFYMGPMMNLAAMRKEGIWERLLVAHQEIGQDEQISLTAACAWRVGAAHPKWNLVPQWDKLQESENWSREAPEKVNMTRPAGVSWHRGIPEGLIHWTGAAKPWHSYSKVWRADLWKSEICSWEILRSGRWEKYRARVIGAANPENARALLGRGWRVEMEGGCEATGLVDTLPGFPDLLSSDAPAAANAIPPDIVRFGNFSDPVSWLKNLPELPGAIAIEGPVDSAVLDELRAIGYREEFRFERTKWPAGGPHPGVLEYTDPGAALPLDARDDLYLILPGYPADRAEPRRPSKDSTTPSTRDSPHPPTLETPSLPDCVECCAPGTKVLWLNPSQPSFVPTVAARLTDLRIVASDVLLWKELILQNWQSAQPTLEYCQLDPVSGWYDLSHFDKGFYDLIIVDSFPTGRNANPAFHPMAGSLLRSRGKLILTAGAKGEDPSPERLWLENGWKVRWDSGGAAIFTPPPSGRKRRVVTSRAVHAIWRDFQENAYVISLPERKDRRADLAVNWAELGIRYRILPGVTLKADEVKWSEMKGMEAYGNPANLRGDYIPRAVGCKRAIINALREFLTSGKAHGLVCEDDCRWRPGAGGLIRRAIADLPRDWDMLYFSASRRKPHLPETTLLMRLTGARMSTAILWTRHGAEHAVATLEASDKECDMTLEGLHAEMKAYAVHPMPAYQGFSKSSITGTVAAHGNR